VKDLLSIVLILACPLAMAWMMRRGHGHGGNARSHGGYGRAEHFGQAILPTDELRPQRDELDELIASRERAEDSPAPGEQ